MISKKNSDNLYVINYCVSQLNIQIIKKKNIKEKNILSIIEINRKETSSPKGNDRSPESNVPMSNLI